MHPYPDGYKCFVLFLSVLLGLLGSPLSYAAPGEAFLFVIQKEEEKKQRRWTLGEWLAATATDRSAIRQEWFAYQSNLIPFEGMIGGDFGNYEFIDSGPYLYHGAMPIFGRHKLQQGHLALYYSILGLNVKAENSEERYRALSAGLDLRLLGESLQGTHLTFQVGMRDVREDVRFVNTYVGAFSTIYLLKFIGVELLYRYFFITSSFDSIDKRKARLYELSAFIEISFIRLYGTYFDEISDYESGNITYKKNKHGPLFGAKFFF